jgi:hypothetical protein
MPFQPAIARDKTPQAALPHIAGSPIPFNRLEYPVPE